MRWKLLRRRLSLSAPRVSVRSSLPWPLRWALVALMLGFSAAIAMWAYQFGKNISGVDDGADAVVTQSRLELDQLRRERDSAVAVANTAESLLKAERVAQERLAQQVRQLQAENLSLQSDLALFERLVPAESDGRVKIRSVQAEIGGPGRLHYQVLAMQAGKNPREFVGRIEVTLIGTLDGKPWNFVPLSSAGALRMKQYARIEAVAEYPADAVLQTVQIRVLDDKGGVRAQHTAKL